MKGGKQWNEEDDRIVGYREKENPWILERENTEEDDEGRIIQLCIRLLFA